jgi:hypothetical protein
VVTLICRKCQYAVRRSQVKAYLISTVHRIPSVWAQHIQITVQEWDHIQDEPQVESWPRQIDDRIPELTIHDDGIMFAMQRIYMPSDTHHEGPLVRGA